MSRCALTPQDDDAAGNVLLKLAKKQGMNCVFVNIGQDCVDACERLAQLNLTGTTARGRPRARELLREGEHGPCPSDGHLFPIYVAS
jgi:hypothetical protein